MAVVNILKLPENQTRLRICKKLSDNGYNEYKHVLLGRETKTLTIGQIDT